MMNRNIIVAYDENRAIGKENHLLWGQREMQEDMKRFRTLTRKATVIMGRKTLVSIGAALPGRRNIVLSTDHSLVFPGVEVVNSLDEAYATTSQDNSVFVIGGSSIYEQAINNVDRIFATEVAASIDGADSFFPILDKEWKAVESEDYKSDENNIYPYRFVTYERD